MTRLLLVGVAFAIVGCGPTIDPNDVTQQAYAATLGIDLGQFTAAAGGLFFRDGPVGSGVAASPGSTLTMSYRGYLTDGSDFTASDPGRDAFTVDLSRDRLIDGFTEGLLGDGAAMPPMNGGGQRRLLIPPSLGYGSRGVSGAIPTNATLIFDIGLSTVR